VAFCEALSKEENKERLSIELTKCWMTQFADCLLRQGRRFPSLAWEFDEAAIACGAAAEKLLWLEGSSVRAMSVASLLTVGLAAPDEQVLRIRKEWDGFLAEEASFVPGAFHVSPLWVEADSRSELISGTVSTLGILLVLSFGGMLVFTGSLVLSLFVVISTVCTLCFLSWACWRASP